MHKKSKGKDLSWAKKWNSRDKVLTGGKGVSYGKGYSKTYSN